MDEMTKKEAWATSRERALIELVRMTDELNFAGVIEERGRDYAARGKVLNFSFSADGSGVSGTVGGSALEPYAVGIRVGFHKNGSVAAPVKDYKQVATREGLGESSTVFVSCQCPFHAQHGLVCKHLVALGVVAQASLESELQSACLQSSVKGALAGAGIQGDDGRPRPRAPSC